MLPTNSSIAFKRGAENILLRIGSTLAGLPYLSYIQLLHLGIQLPPLGVLEQQKAYCA